MHISHLASFFKLLSIVNESVTQGIASTAKQSKTWLVASLVINRGNIVDGLTSGPCHILSSGWSLRTWPLLKLAALQEKQDDTSCADTATVDTCPGQAWTNSRCSDHSNYCWRGHLTIYTSEKWWETGEIYLFMESFASLPSPTSHSPFPPQSPSPLRRGRYSLGTSLSWHIKSLQDRWIYFFFKLVNCPVVATLPLHLTWF